ncbi:MAG: hypothetical protein WBH68_00805 [Erysipelotrichaceae bacterium]|jgi:hypothetical protein|nr:hypothetical protein [Bacillota bacterium]
MPENIVSAVIYAMVIASIYAVLYYLNHKTPVPKGCENLNVKCEGCKISSCELHPSRKIKEEVHD